MAARLNASTRKTAPKNDPNPRAVEGDNAAAVEEAERLQLISIVSKLSDAEDQIEVAKGPLQAAQKHRKTIIGLGKAAGFTAEELKARLDEMKRPSREMAERVEREGKQRRWLGILTPEQTELALGDKVPQDAKDEAHWKGEGYKAGLRQMGSNPPPECPQMHTQAFMKEHDRGLKEVLAANVPGGQRLSVREQAAADFAEDEPEIDLDAAARKLKKSSFMTVEDLAEVAVEVLAEIVDEIKAGPDEPFEATEEELQAQSTRRAVQDAAAGATSGEVV